MTISVIIPTKNRFEDLLNTLKSVLAQSVAPNEVIIIDQNESSGVKDAVHSLFEGSDTVKDNDIALKYVHNTSITGAAQAKNKGVEQNESDAILFLDDDVILEKEFIYSMLAIYDKNPDVYAVGGIMTNMDMGFVDVLMNNIFSIGGFSDKRTLVYTQPGYRDAEMVEVTKLSSGLTSFKKEVFQKFRFDESFVKHSFSEDMDFSFRVSRDFKIVMTPKARLEHVNSHSGRVDHKKSIENLLMSRHFFFKKNLEKNFYNYMCFIWLNVGYSLKALLLAIFKQDIDVLRGTVNGLKKIIKGEDCDFIQPPGRSGQER